MVCRKALRISYCFWMNYILCSCFITFSYLLIFALVSTLAMSCVMEDIVYPSVRLMLLVIPSTLIFVLCVTLIPLASLSSLSFILFVEMKQFVLIVFSLKGQWSL